MFHPIRWTKRKLRTTTSKVMAALLVVSGAGGGTAAVAPDSVPGQIGHEVVRVVQYGVDNLTGTTGDGHHEAGR